MSSDLGISLTFASEPSKETQLLHAPHVGHADFSDEWSSDDLPLDVEDTFLSQNECESDTSSTGSPVCGREGITLSSDTEDEINVAAASSPSHEPGSSSEYGLDVFVSFPSGDGLEQGVFRSCGIGRYLRQAQPKSKLL